MSLLIKNVQVIDGTNRPPLRADILVKKERIMAIGNFAKYKAEEVIDGRGAYAAPGFIDVNNHSDHYGALVTEPLQEHFIAQGVTTIIGGQCGISLAPLLYGSLGILRPWIRESAISVNWHGMREYLRTLEKIPMGVNVGTLVGHTSVKQEVTGNASRDCSTQEKKIVAAMLEKALEEGAFGCSLELTTSIPQKNLTHQELIMVGKILAKHKAPATVHLETEKDTLMPSLQKAITLSKEMGIKVIISHFLPTRGGEKEYEEALTRINKESAGADIYFDYAEYPNIEMPLVALLPIWREGNKDTRAIIKWLEIPEHRNKILENLPTISAEQMRITRAPDCEYLEGTSLREFAENRDIKNYHEAIMQLLILTKCRIVMTFPQLHQKLHESIFHERGIIASNDTNHGRGRELRYQAYTDILKKAHEQKLLPVHTVVHKMTGLPAKIMDIRERGVLQNGNYADILVMRDGAIEEVIINGTRVMRDKKVEKIFAGKVIARE